MTVREELAALPLEIRIERLIADGGGTQDHLAEVVGAARETVNRWVNGAEPKRQFRRKLAEHATQVYNENIPETLFRRVIRGSSPEAQLVQTAQGLTEATQALVGLLGEQRQIVREMTQTARGLSRLVAALEQREAASGNG